jgi:hypothetical protein
MTSSRGLAPICVFTYSRLEHTRQLIESLKKNPESSKTDLTIFVDGPKNEEARPSVEKVRDYVVSLEGFRSLTVIERTENLGLARSIILGVTQMLEKSESVIVLEDDLVLSPSFLKYMNEGLTKFADQPEVASIHGYLYPLLEKPSECFFIRGADCWGWATWKRAWPFFEPDGQKLLSALENQGLANEFDFGGSHPYMQMLRNQVAGKNNSWAIRWNASCFLNGMLTLYPSQSLVENRGFDGSGEHCDVSGEYTVERAHGEVRIEDLEILESAWGRQAFENYFWSIRPSFAQKVRAKFRRLWGRL